MKNTPFLILLFVLCPLFRLFAVEFPSQTVPNTFGVCIVSVPLEEVDFAALKEAGFQWVRKGVNWNSVEENTKGEYDFTIPDALVKKCEDNDMGLVMNLAFGNKLYEPKSPRMYIGTDAGREAFANYCAAIAKRYKGKKIIYVFWNEASGSFWKSPNYKDVKAAAAEYMAMQNLAADKMKAIDPDCLIAGASLFELNWKRTSEWLDVCLELGTQKNCDAIDFHGYCGRPQNDMPELNIQAYRDMQKLLVQHGVDENFPFLQTEYGINIQFDYWDGTHEQGEVKQAQSVVRMYLVSLLLKMPINIHYEYQSRKEATRGDKGLYNKDGSEAPVMNACRTVMSVLKGYTFSERLDNYGPDNYVLVFKNDSGDTKLACWTSPRDGSSSISLPINSTKPLKTWGLFGEAGTLTPQEGKVTLTLTNSPLYLQIP